jgi:hypothetical protein
MLEGLSRRSRSTIEWLAGLTSVGCVALLAARTWGAVSLSTPLLVGTSGFEEESLLTIWRHAHGGPIYTRLDHVPFSWSVFNWLYYVSYAGIVRLLGRADVWLPTICRLVTLAGALAGSALAFLAFRQVRPRAHWVIYLSFATLAGLGRWLGSG